MLFAAEIGWLISCRVQTEDGFICTPWNGMIDFQNDPVTQWSCTLNDRLWFRGSPFSLVLLIFNTITPYFCILRTHHKTLTTEYSLVENQEAARARISTDRQTPECKTIKCSRVLFILHYLFKATDICINNRSRVILEAARLGMSRGGKKRKESQLFINQSKKELSINPLLLVCKVVVTPTCSLAVFVLPCNDVLSHNSIAHCPSTLFKYYFALKYLFSVVSGIPFMMCRLMHRAEVWRWHGNLVTMYVSGRYVRSLVQYSVCYASCTV